MKRNFKKLLSLLMVSVLVITVFASCSSGSGDGNDTMKIAIVTDSAGQNDNGYNQAAVKGAEQVKKDFGFDYKIVEPTNGVPATLEALASDNYDIIFNLEYDFDALIKGVAGAKPIAEQYPDTTFVVFNDNPNVNDDGSARHKNVISVLFDVHEASYVAGALAVQVVENATTLFDSANYSFTPLDKGGRSIGFVGGTNSNGITVFSYGFVEGINHAAKDLNVKYDYYSKYDAGFADPSLGNTIAGTFFNSGANAIFSVAGGVGDGVAAKAKEMKKLAIQVDANKDAQQSGYILTSVLKNTNVPVFEISKALKEGKISEMPRLQTYSLGSGATGVTDMTEISKHISSSEAAQTKWTEIKAYCAALQEKISKKEIKVTNASIGEEFKPANNTHVTIK